MATIVFEDLSPVKKKVTFEVPEETVRDAIESEYRDIKKTAQIKGFRKGKAPLQIIKGYFHGKVEADALRKVIEDTLEPGLEEQNIKPLSILSIDPEDFEKGRPFKFSAQIEVAPKISLTNYKGLNLKKPVESVSDEEVEENLERIRRMNAKLAAIPEGRGAQNGDYLIVDVDAEADGESIAALSVDDYHVEMGRDFYLPGFDVHLEGIKVEEDREVIIDFPEDFPNKSLAGKKGIFHVACKEAKERIIPPLDDEFARDLGGFQNLQDLKERVRRDLEEEMKTSAKKDSERQIMDQLLESHDFQVPDSMVEREIDIMVQSFMQAYRARGIDPEKLSQSSQIAREELRPAAIKQAKAALILQTIADQEAIEATEEELEKEYEELAQQWGVDADKVKELTESNKPSNVVKSGIIREKTYRFLQENAVLVEENETVDQQKPATATETT